jgi:hypothetical protein
MMIANDPHKNGRDAAMNDLVFRHFFQPTRGHRILRTGLILLLGVSITSCSMRRIALKHHEFFAAQFAANQLDLSHNQKDEFRQLWKIYSSRVTATKIEPLAKLIESFGETNNPSKIAANIQTEITGALHDACSDFSPLVARLSAEQLTKLQENLADRNKKFDPNKNGGLIQYRKQRQKDLRSNLEKWLGKANEAQQKIILDLDLQKDPHGQWEQDYLVYSGEAQKAFLSVIQDTLGNPGAFEKKCGHYLNNQDVFLSAESRKIKSDLAESRGKILESLFQAADPAQRDHLKRETSKLANDLRAWAAEVRGES